MSNACRQRQNISVSIRSHRKLSETKSFWIRRNDTNKARNLHSSGKIAETFFEASTSLKKDWKDKLVWRWVFDVTGFLQQSQRVTKIKHWALDGNFSYGLLTIRFRHSFFNALHALKCFLLRFWWLESERLGSCFTKKPMTAGLLPVVCVKMSRKCSNLTLFASSFS